MVANEAGFACCGNCGAEAHVVCSGGCANADIEIRENPIAALPVPKGDEKRSRRSGFCHCGDPVAVRAPGKGRPPTTCEKHLAQRKRYRLNWEAKRGPGK